MASLTIKPEVISRLKNQLLVSNLKDKDPALYQVINQLIGLLQGLAQDTKAINNNPASNTIINNTVFASDLFGSGSDGGDDMTIPGPRGIDGSNGMVPYFIASGEIFLVPVFKQALFEMNIDNEGDLQVDGFLIEV